MLQQRARHLARCMAIFICGLAAIAANAADVEIRVSEQVSATADFRPGKTGKPAILILHGFLQTREFGIIKSLTDTLADAGYTVLSPTLSLGISYRKSSLNCEALHLHDMAGDVSEIQQWVQWLRKRGYTQIIGLGHSFGATQLLAWAERYPDREFTLVGVSLTGATPFKPNSKPAAMPKGMASKDLLHAPLSFCETYIAPARQYASYYEWMEKRVLTAAKAFKGTTYVILGSADNYIPQGWAGKLSKAGVKTVIIKGANHFMEGTHEFDMLEATLDILKS